MMICCLHPLISLIISCQSPLQPSTSVVGSASYSCCLRLSPCCSASIWVACSCWCSTTAASSACSSMWFTRCSLSRCTAVTSVATWPNWLPNKSFHICFIAAAAAAAAGIVLGGVQDKYDVANWEGNYSRDLCTLSMWVNVGLSCCCCRQPCAGRECDSKGLSTHTNRSLLTPLEFRFAAVRARQAPRGTFAEVEPTIT